MLLCYVVSLRKQSKKVKLIEVNSFSDLKLPCFKAYFIHQLTILCLPTFFHIYPYQEFCIGRYLTRSDVVSHRIGHLYVQFVNLSDNLVNFGQSKCNKRFV